MLRSLAALALVLACTLPAAAQTSAATIDAFVVGEDSEFWYLEIPTDQFEAKANPKKNKTDSWVTFTGNFRTIDEGGGFCHDEQQAIFETFGYPGYDVIQWFENVSISKALWMWHTFLGGTVGDTQAVGVGLIFGGNGTFNAFTQAGNAFSGASSAATTMSPLGPGGGAAVGAGKMLGQAMVLTGASLLILSVAVNAGTSIGKFLGGVDYWHHGSTPHVVGTVYGDPIELDNSMEWINISGSYPCGGTPGFDPAWDTGHETSWSAIEDACHGICDKEPNPEQILPYVPKTEHEETESTKTPVE